MLNNLVGIPEELHFLVNALVGINGLIGIAIGWLGRIMCEEAKARKILDDD